jgi:hypothetical protein
MTSFSCSERINSLNVGICIWSSVGSNPATSTRNRRLTRDFVLIIGLFRVKRHEKGTRIFDTISRRSEKVTMLFSSQLATTQGACAAKLPSPTSFGGSQRCTGFA